MDSDSLVKHLFLGELPAALVLPYPVLAPDAREFLDMFRQSLARFAALKVDSRDIDKQHRIPPEVMDGLAELGLFGVRIAEEHGGLDLNMTQYVRLGADLSVLDGAVAILSGGHSTIGIKALQLYGTPEQQARWLPRLATGELKAGFALSEAGAGSDAQSLRCTARRQPDGSYVISGDKLWITNGGFADLLTVFVRTPDHPRADGRPSISCFLVERAQGFRSGPEEDKLGIRGSSTTPILFEDVRVPAENLLGAPGDGFKIALHVLNAGRTGLAGGCLGEARFLLEEAVNYTAQRRQFDRPIGEFELIREKLGRCALDTHALECMTFLATGRIDAGARDVALESALCKVFGTETLWMVVNDAIQCAGGNGFTTDYPYERMLRDPGWASFGAMVAKDAAIEPAREALLAALEGPAREPVTDAEVERARTTLLNDMEKAPLDSLGYVRWLGEFASMGDWRLFFLYRERVRKATTADVQSALERFVKPANRVLGTFVPTAAPERAEIPPRPDVAAMVAGYRGQEGLAPGEAFDATPANLEARLIRRELANGIRVALLPKKTRGGNVHLSLSLYWGDEASKEKRATACALAPTHSTPFSLRASTIE